jgi:hypothetical protein
LDAQTAAFDAKGIAVFDVHNDTNTEFDENIKAFDAKAEALELKDATFEDHTIETKFCDIVFEDHIVVLLVAMHVSFTTLKALQVGAWWIDVFEGEFTKRLQNPVA